MSMTGTDETERIRRGRRLARIRAQNDQHPAPLTEIIEGTRVEWSRYRELGAHPWQGMTAVHAGHQSPYREQFTALVHQFAAKASRHEKITVGWWYAPYIYIQAEDIRHQGEYPVWMRALVSFDLTNGQVMGRESSNRYGFARRGWGAFTDRIAGYRVTRYKG
jgi:hypothetical protein